MESAYDLLYKSSKEDVPHLAEGIAQVRYTEVISV